MVTNYSKIITKVFMILALLLMLSGVASPVQAAPPQEGVEPSPEE